jgi:DNA replication licensing factor MCM6
MLHCVVFYLTHSRQSTTFPLCFRSDKMDPADQVAIHEAMEQQTISITKAGIQATLNARASILAAANPILGRYDRTKTLKANVALSAPILSRFDLFFVVLDECNPQADRRVAQHILQVHRFGQPTETAVVPFTKEQMQRYIRFARTINPKLTRESQAVLVDCYRKLRQGDSMGRSRTAYRITVRQLESMIRLSEAKARLHCDPEIQPDYVREAFRLLKMSIIQVETSNVDVEEDDGNEDDDDDDEDGKGAGGDPMEETGGQSNESQESTDEPETQPPPTAHPGEYTTASTSTSMDDAPLEEPPKKKKKKTKISYEEYEGMASAIAAHLRSLESEEDESATREHYLTWAQVVEWYLGQVEHDMGDSLEVLADTRQKVNLVIRRLVSVDHVLVTVGTPPANKKEEPKAILAVHPNYVL